jgi:hypothetical protein
MNSSSKQKGRQKKFHYKNDLSYPLALWRENNNIDSALPSIEIPWRVRIEIER